MNSSTGSKPSPKLILTACLSGGLNLVLSLVYVVLCILAIVYRFDCNAVSLDSNKGSIYFFTTIYRVYIQKEECDTSIQLENITGDYPVFVLVAITLAASLVLLIAAIVLISAVTTEAEVQYLKLFVYGYVGVCIASLIVDITFATHFGMDYSHLTGILDTSSPGLSFNYERDVIRLGAFLLMTLSLKGFIGHIINIILLVLLVIYLKEYTSNFDSPQHPIHKLGVIKAFDSQKNKDCQHQCEICQIYRGPQLNYGYSNDDEPPRTPMRENSRTEFTNPSFDRSYSWQPGPGSNSSRPFSYLEEATRPSPARPPTSPAGELPWRRDPWPALTPAPPVPPVPAPDYSPHAPRRLKPALKSYM